MKILDKVSAAGFIESQSENTLVISVEVPGKEYAFLKAIEENEEGLHVYRYANGAGWSIKAEAVKASIASKTSLIDLLAEEQGKRMGDIRITDDYEVYVIIDYINGDHGTEYTYICGSDDEVKKILPHLTVGEYCFIFRDETDYSSEEEIYRTREKEYLMEDARNHVELFVAGIDDIDDNTKEFLYGFFESHYADMADEFINRKDCNIPDNSIWDNIVSDYYDAARKTAV